MIVKLSKKSKMELSKVKKQLEEFLFKKEEDEEEEEEGQLFTSISRNQRQFVFGYRGNLYCCHPAPPGSGELTILVLERQQAGLVDNPFVYHVSVAGEEEEEEEERTNN